MSASPRWDVLRGRFPVAWVDSLERAEVRGKSVHLDRDLLVTRPISSDDRERYADLAGKATELLDELAESGWLTPEATRYECPVCGHDLGEDPPPDTCPNLSDDGTSHAYDENDDEGPRAIAAYRRAGIERRDAGWLFALHGMNTRGDWQESFNWMVSTSYGRMVPVAIYKYGVVRPGVLSRNRHETLMEQVADRIRRAGREVAKIIDDPRPDVIAHSFGTFLLGHALHRFPDLKVGRVITLGCILRPDFDWGTLAGRGQVDAVLNNYGTKDFWARVAHNAIPDAGPAGRRGFDFYEESWPNDMRAEGRRRLFNVEAAGLKHSDFFKDPEEGSTLRRLFRDVWKPFLTIRDADDLAAALDWKWPAERWQPSRWPLRALTGGWEKAKNTVR